jgi:ribonuclease HI
MTVDNTLEIYTDGSSFQSPRVGGIGIRFVWIDSTGDDQVQDVQFAGYKNATNNQMELQACIMALKETSRLQLTSFGIIKIIIFTDSLYICENIGKAKFEWPKQKWFLRSGRPVSNAEQWKELVKCIRDIKILVDFQWVKGHSKNLHNNAADKMAKQSAKLPINNPLSIVHVRRKLTSQSVGIGSVEMRGQRMSIRVITSEYLKVQRISKHKYEVISSKSEYYGNVDLIYGDEHLQAGHSYYVKVNNDTSNPRIEKVFRELKKT